MLDEGRSRDEHVTCLGDAASRANILHFHRSGGLYAAYERAPMPPDLNTLPPSPHVPAAIPSPPSLAAAAVLNAGMHSHDAQRSSSGSASIRRSAEHARRRSSIRLPLALNDSTLPAAGELHALTSPRHERAPSLGELHQALEYEQEGQVNRLLTMIRHQHDTTTSPHDHHHHHQQHHLDPLPAPAPTTSPSRDEAAFYQAETQNLTRENQMLKLRIRELGTLNPLSSPCSPPSS